MSQNKKKNIEKKKPNGIKKKVGKYHKKIKVNATFEELMNLAINIPRK